MSHACLSIWSYQDSGGDESSLFIFCRKATYTRLWFVAPHFGLWGGQLCDGLLFSGRVKLSLKGVEHAQVLDLFISKSSIGAFAANEVRQDLIYQLQAP